MIIYIDRTTGKASLSQTPLTFAISLPDDFTLTKTIQIQSGEKQKTNEQGELLYKTNVQIDDLGKETYTETTEAQTTTKTEPQEQTITYTDENGTEQTETVTVEVPVEWEDNEPVMIPNMVDKTIDIIDNPSEFTVDEVINAKFKNILEPSSNDYILADMFLNEDDIDLTDVNHKANTGVAIMQLLPSGQAKTKEITLAKAAKLFTLLEFITDDGVDIYINDIKFTDNLATLTEVTDKCTIKFVNSTNKPKMVYSYAIGY